MKTLIRLHYRFLLLSFATIATHLSCNQRADTHGDEIVVFAAASLADALREVANDFEKSNKCKVLLNTGASGKLAAQIKSGAPCDIFIPADAAYLDDLIRSNTIRPNTRTEVAGNELVVVCHGTGQKIWPDLSGLGKDDIKRISVASPEHAPAGKYARQALSKMGMWDSLQPRIVLADDVRFAARYVAEGAVEVGIVYATDARAFADKLTIVYHIRPTDHDAIQYEAAVCIQSKQSALCDEFLRFAASPACRIIWERNGFLTPRPMENSGRSN